jgi:hypothetical protein
MLKPFLLAVLLTFTFTTIHLHAQDAAPWPPDPDEIFAEGVEVVDVEIYVYPEIVVDNLARAIKIYKREPSEYFEFSFPNEVTSIMSYPRTYRKRSDGTILFNIPESFKYIPDVWPEMWLLNPQTGEFSRPEIICDKYPQALPGEGYWVFYTDPQVNHATLCNTETGELEGIFSKNLYWQAVSENPTGEWLLLEASTDEHIWSLSTIQYYSYNLSTKDLLYLGEIENGEEKIRKGEWLTDTTILIYSGHLPEGRQKSYYHFDLTQANSAHFVIDGRARYYESPKRYEYLMTYFEVFHRADWGAPCQINTYEFSTGTTYTKTLANHCFGMVQRQSNHYFYVSFSSVDSDKFSLYSIDITNNQIQEWMIDNIAALANVSPNGRYITFLLNNNHYLPPWENEKGFPTYPDLDPFNYDRINFVEGPYGVYDTQNNQWVDEFNHTVPVWIAENQFITLENFYVEPAIAKKISLFNVSSEGLSEKWTINNLDSTDWELSPDKSYILLDTDYGASSIIYLQTSQITQITYSRQSTGYSISGARWVGRNTLNYHVTKADAAPYYAIYTIRIPQPEGQTP